MSHNGALKYQLYSLVVEKRRKTNYQSPTNNNLFMIIAFLSSSLSLHVLVLSAARRWLLTTNIRVQSQITSDEICSRRSDTGVVRFPASLSPSHEVCDSPGQETN
jgi:hypothetical protein